MKHSFAWLPLAASLVALPAWGQDYRLAFSQNDRLEVFIDGKTADNWCSSSPVLRLASQVTPVAATIEGIVPKLGALMSAQCAQAEQFQWTAFDPQGKEFANGVARKADQWIAKVEPLVTAADLDQTAPAPIETASAPQAAAVPEAAPAPAPAPVQPEPVATAPVQVPAVAQPTVEVEKPEAVKEVATPEPVAAAAPVPAPAAPAVQAQQEPPKAPTAAPAPVSQTVTIQGWSADKSARALNLDQILTTLKDQNGCAIRTVVEMEGHADYALQSEGRLSCNANGMLDGQGNLSLLRGDGKVLASTGTIYVKNGLPMQGDAILPEPMAFNGKDEFWYLLGNDPQTQSVVLAMVKASTYSGIGVMRNNDARLVVIHGQESTFRNVNQIRPVIDNALTLYSAAKISSNGHVLVKVWDNFEEGVLLETKEFGWDEANRQAKAQMYAHRLYEISANRSNWGREAGTWRYNPGNANNYVYARAEEAEREARRKLMEQARQEESRLRDYESIEQRIAQDGPAKYLRQSFRDVDYQLFGDNSGYRRLVQAGANGERYTSFTRIVRVTGSEGRDAKADWPYDLRLIGQAELKKGWYMVTGKLRLDSERDDEDGLPLSLVSLDGPQAVQSCTDDGCADLAKDALSLYRLRLGQPNWTPEQAKAIIEQARKGGN